MINRIEDRIINKLDYIGVYNISQLFECTHSEAGEIIQAYLNRTKLIGGAVLNLSDCSNVTSLGAVREISGGLTAHRSALSDLGDLTFIDGSCELMWCGVDSLGKLEFCGSLLLAGLPLTDMGALEAVDGRAFIQDTDLTDLGNLIRIEGSLTLPENEQLTSLGNLEYVGGDISLNGTEISTLGKLTHIGGSLDARGSALQDIRSLRELGGYIVMKEHQLVLEDGMDILDLGKLSNIFNLPEHLSFVRIPSSGHLVNIGVLIEAGVTDGVGGTF